MKLSYKSRHFETYLDDVMEYYHEKVKVLMLQWDYYDMDNITHCFSYLKEHRYFPDCLFKNGFGYLLLKTICILHGVQRE